MTESKTPEDEPEDADSALYIHMERELERLSRLFPDIYPPEGNE